MESTKERKRVMVDPRKLSDQFFTQMHPPEFWEQLGRTIANYGYLEDVLCRAIYAFTATREYNVEELDTDKFDVVYEEWTKTLDAALTNPLGSLASTYEKAVCDNPKATIPNVGKLVKDIKKASKIRNVLCHASWPPPNPEGKSIPRFVNRDKEVFDTAIDSEFLKQVQAYVSALICTVINSVTDMGYQFPGSNSPGEPI